MTLGDVLASMAGVVMEGADPPRCACADHCVPPEMCDGTPCPGCRRCQDGPWLDDLPAEDLPR